MRYLFPAITILLVVNGCMKVGPDYHRPYTGIHVPAHYEHGPAETVTPQPDEHWWEAYSDVEINRLVDEVLENNLDIKKATARILEVRSELVQARADRFPILSLQGQGERQQRPIIGIMPGRSFSVLSETYTLSLPASFEVDLWGRLARGQEAARADLLQAEENRRTVAQTVVAETINLYLLIESLERRIRIALDKIESYGRSLAFVEGRYEHGLTSILDVMQARRALAQAEADLPSLRQDLGITQQRLSVLAGRY
ncbi:MAG: TolC family protein, partial [Deltaproteobacteria bacterium]|nr:TolC family protein [Deltaproteobacteria bacterium]